MRVALPCKMLVVLITLSISPVRSDGKGSSPRPAIDEVREETWRYRIVNEGEAAGSTVIDFRRREGILWIHDISTLEPDIAEDMLVRIDARTGEPASLDVHGDFGGVHVNGQFAVESGRLRGAFVQHRVTDAAEGRVVIDEPMTDRTRLRAALIWLAHTLPLEVGATWDYRWFMALGGRFEEVELRVEGVEEVRVPAGSFETFKIVQEGGTPGNVLYVTTGRPRRTVRVDVVGRPMTIELERVVTVDGEGGPSALPVEDEGP